MKTKVSESYTSTPQYLTTQEIARIFRLFSDSDFCLLLLWIYL